MIADEQPDLLLLDPALRVALMDSSPRLVVERPVLIRHDSSPTGWIVLVPVVGTRLDRGEIDFRAR